MRYGTIEQNIKDYFLLMEIRKHNYIEIHYDKHEQKAADKYAELLKRYGYDLVSEDDGINTDFCDQYVRRKK